MEIELNVRGYVIYVLRALRASSSLHVCYVHFMKYQKFVESREKIRDNMRIYLIFKRNCVIYEILCCSYTIRIYLMF